MKQRVAVARNASEAKANADAPVAAAPVAMVAGTEVAAVVPAAPSAAATGRLAAVVAPSPSARAASTMEIWRRRRLTMMPTRNSKRNSMNATKLVIRKLAVLTKARRLKVKKAREGNTVRAEEPKDGQLGRMSVFVHLPKAMSRVPGGELTVQKSLPQLSAALADPEGDHGNRRQFQF